MHVFEMIVLVVGIGVFGGIITQYLTNKADQTKSEGDIEADKRIKALEDRVAVLEKLATDKGRTLADEIDSL